MVGVYVGKTPWIALAVLESLYVALVGGASALLQRAPSPADAPRVRPLAVALLWVGQEALRDRTPFGGFPWARLAFSQADSPLVHLAALGGAPAVTFGVALVGAVAAAAVSRLGWAATGRGLSLRHGGRPVTGVGRAVPVLALAGALLLAPLLVPVPTDGTPARFTAVQGNVPRRAGLQRPAPRRARQPRRAPPGRWPPSVDAGTQPQPDLVVWPENSSDIDPLRNADAAARSTTRVRRRRRADRSSAPCSTGRATHVSNVAPASTEPGQRRRPQRYVKRHPVPFAEYIPYRSFFRIFSDKVDLVRATSPPATGPGVFQVPRPPAAIGGRRSASRSPTTTWCATPSPAGANLLVVQTNNATFGYTDRVRASSSRCPGCAPSSTAASVVHVSTVGVSALITPDGTVASAQRVVHPGGRWSAQRAPARRPTPSPTGSARWPGVGRGRWPRCWRCSAVAVGWPAPPDASGRATDAASTRPGADAVAEGPS